MKRLASSALVALGAFLAACGMLRSPAPDPVPGPSGFKVVWASWYGAAHHGKRTASGEIYDMHGMTVAHRSLPLGTRLLVENPRNGRRVAVRVNDRGPFVDGRDLDLSYAVARALGAVGEGVFRVRYRILARPPTR